MDYSKFVYTDAKVSEGEEGGGVEGGVDGYSDGGRESKRKRRKDKKSKKKGKKEKRHKSSSSTTRRGFSPSTEHRSYGGGVGWREEIEDEASWRERLMENLAEEELDFWYSQFQSTEPVDNYTEPGGVSVELTEEEYGEYISRGMGERRKGRETTLPPYRGEERSRKRIREEGGSTRRPPRSSTAASSDKGVSESIDTDRVARENLLRWREEYYTKWESLTDQSKNKLDTTGQPEKFNLQSIPWPFTPHTISELISKLDRGDSDYQIETIFTRKRLLTFLSLDTNGPLSRAQQTEVKQNLKVELLRWHPDKFNKYRLLPKVSCTSSGEGKGVELSSEGKVEVAIKLINHISQLLKESWSQL